MFGFIIVSLICMNLTVLSKDQIDIEIKPYNVTDCLTEGTGGTGYKTDEEPRCSGVCINYWGRTCKQGSPGCSPLTCKQ